MQPLAGIRGCGLGLRREFLNDLPSGSYQPDWYELTPENWIHMPYQYREVFHKAVEGFSLVAHGLSLSIGSPDLLNKKFLSELKDFLDEYNIKHYSEHLSFSVCVTIFQRKCILFKNLSSFLMNLLTPQIKKNI